MLKLKTITHILAPVALSIALISPALAQTISIKGTGIITSAPDIAHINIGVSSNAATARIALDKNTKAMSNIINALTKSDVEGKDIQTSNFSINPRYNQKRDNNQLPAVIGYEVFNTLDIKITNLESLGNILDQVVTLGSNRINNIRFGIAKPMPLEDKARALAANDAKRRAEIYAQTLGFSLGKIISINEGVSRNQPYQNVMMKRGMVMDAMESSAAPIEAGEQAITSNVNITWEIKQ